MKDKKLLQELKRVKTRQAAGIFLWKIHNMVIHAQYPNAPLFFDGFQELVTPQNQSYTLKGGQKLYNDDGGLTPMLKTQVAQMFTPGKGELDIDILTATFEAQIYNGVEQRWRAAGGLVPTPSLYAAEPMNAASKKAWKETQA